MRTVSRTVARGVPLVLTVTLFLMWLLLNDTLSLGSLLLGLLLAIVLAWASGALRPLRPKIRCAHLTLVLLGFVLHDIIRSNINVARVVLGLQGREVRSGFVKIPLDLEDPHGLAVLACIVTATPGTVWIDHDAAARVLTLHVLDLGNETEWIDWVKNRHERLLRRIFE